jgi:hypothetical protein
MGSDFLPARFLRTSPSAFAILRSFKVSLKSLKDKMRKYRRDY